MVGVVVVLAVVVVVVVMAVVALSARECRERLYACSVSFFSLTRWGTHVSLTSRSALSAGVLGHQKPKAC